MDAEFIQNDRFNTLWFVQNTLCDVSVVSNSLEFEDRKIAIIVAKIKCNI